VTLRILFAVAVPFVLVQSDSHAQNGHHFVVVTHTTMTMTWRGRLPGEFAGQWIVERSDVPSC
jgi:hypothetical protein